MCQVREGIAQAGLGGGQGFNKRQGAGRLHDVISSRIIFDIVEKSCV